MRGLTLNQKEQARLQVLNGVLQRRVSLAEAAQIMGVSERQAWLIVAVYRREGAAALVHGNRGRRPPNAIRWQPETSSRAGSHPLPGAEPHSSDRVAGGA